MPKRLRQASADPQVSAMVVTAADFLALVAAYVTLRLWSNGEPLSWDVVRPTIETLVSESIVPSGSLAKASDGSVERK